MCVGVCVCVCECVCGRQCAAGLNVGVAVFGCEGCVVLWSTGW